MTLKDYSLFTGMHHFLSTKNAFADIYHHTISDDTSYTLSAELTDNLYDVRDNVNYENRSQQIFNYLLDLLNCTLLISCLKTCYVCQLFPN
jgi:hypothetical protein